MTTHPPSDELQTVSVIIATTCEGGRGDLLLRAIESVVAQTGVATHLLIVVNGRRYDETLLQRLKADKRLEVIYLEQANFALARYAGVCRVSSQFFCFLDDDDELLPDASSTRVKLFNVPEGAEADIVVTNGYECAGGRDSVLLPPEAAEKIARNPGASFLEQNWFASCAPLFKSASVDPELFNFSVKYFEQTYLFFLLLSKGKRFRYHDAITYRINKDNPLSVSKSAAYEHAAAEFLADLLRLPLDAELRHKIRQRYVIALNTRSNLALTQGRLWDAWLTHLKCLGNGGWRYVPFTRRLILQSLLRSHNPDNQIGNNESSRH